ncbi:MAG: uncharacterized protein JWO05_3318 [Gemmatimonadetes bacterium]|nr:uncharacterized protein [Gemmatimonadota bacterium]
MDRVRESPMQFYSRKAGITSLAFSWFAGPVCVLFEEMANYALVPHGCRNGTTVWMHLVLASLTAIILVSGGTAIRDWRRIGGGEPSEEGGVAGRTRFAAVVGMVSAAFFLVVMIAQWLPLFYLDPCVRA